MASKDTVPTPFTSPPSPHTQPLPPLTVLLIFRFICGLHLFIAAILPREAFPLLSNTAPIQVSFLLFISGFSNTYSHALSHRHRRFSAQRFYVSRFALLYPIYLLALLVHTFAFSSSNQPLHRFFALAAGLTPWTSSSHSFPPNDAPLIAYTLLPCLALAYLVFPVLLDLFPRFHTSKPAHLRCAAVAIALLPCIQAFWLSHLPGTEYSSRPFMLVDLLAYVPFLAQLPAFALGMIMALLFLSDLYPADLNNHSPFFRANLITILLPILYLLSLAHGHVLAGSEHLKSDHVYSVMLDPLLYGLLLTIFAILVRTCVDWSFYGSRPQDVAYRASFAQTSVSGSPVRLFPIYSDYLYHMSTLGTTLYVLAAPVWRSLGAAVCPTKARSSARVAMSAFRSFACADPGEAVTATPHPFQWFSVWPWVHGHDSEVVVTYAAAASAQRLADVTTMVGPRVSLLIYFPVLVLVSVAVCRGIQSPLAAIIVSMYERFVQAAEDGRLAHSPWLARFASVVCLTLEQKKPKRDGSTLERVVRVLLYYVGMASFLWFVFHFSLPLAVHMGEARPGSLFCWLPSSIYSCDDNPTNDGPAGLLGRFGIGSSYVTNVVDVVRWISVLTLPTMILNIFGQVIFPRAIWKRVPTMSEMMEQRKDSDEEMCGEDIQGDKAGRSVPDKKRLDLDFTMYIRYVTRGNNPRLVCKNAKKAADVLMGSGIPRGMWRVEVVTDQALGVEQEVDDPAVYEIVVPKCYEPSGGAKYKARALNYAIRASPAGEMDWIVHLDEETRFDEDTVRAIVEHCGRELYLTRVAKGQKWPRIGQGPIVYGRGMNDGEMEDGNWLTTLADSGRVSDDCGRYRIQYECGEVWVGMHGSFVVACNCVEEKVTFDHGVEGSIAEDAFFAMMARLRGVRFAWIDGLMYEQSPFTVKDFVKQRARWLVGGLRVVNSKRIPWRLSIVMRVLTSLWAMMPLTYAGLVVAVLLGSGSAEQSRMNWYYYYGLLPLLAAVSLWNYVFGFLVSFSVGRVGVVRFLTLLYAQVVLAPVFGVMEVAAVSYGLRNYGRLAVGFHVVQKEEQGEARAAERNGGGGGETEGLVRRGGGWRRGWSGGSSSSVVSV